MGKILYMSHCVFPTPNIKRTSDYYEEVVGFKAVEDIDGRWIGFGIKED